MESQNQNGQPEKNILVVDDDEGIREILQMAFMTEGYSVTTAANGKEALDILSHSPHYGLILLDLMMPKMNGWEFVEAFQKTSHPQIPIILMTAYTDRVKNIDVKEVISKPMDFEALLQRVQANYKENYKS
ncbi:response regulator [Pseudobdellovibrio sp. HCB154]|uniref:response regulator n=1 Tax=Pseudobdellovibrio sp. HCB154 TaxID=3386277 RepID=UPI003916D74F